jgi:DUF4097 and DUF4098 domain-containing protein YvlB
MGSDLQPTTFDTPGQWTLSVSVPQGDLAVSTHQDARTHVEIRNARDPQDVVVRCDERARQVSISQNRWGKFGWRRSGLTVDVVVPEGTDIQVKGESLDVDCRGRLGDLVVNTASGDLSADAVGGELRVHSASGDVSADHVAGPVLLRSASGDIQIGQADHDVTLQSASGDVVVDCLRAGRASVQVVSGDVDLGVAAGLQLRLELSTLSGETRPELDLNGDGSGPPPAVALDVRVRTVSGDITVRRATRLPVELSA